MYCALDIDFSNGGAVDDTTVPVWGDFALRASPNPFNPSTQVSFELAEPGNVEVAIYNARGQRVKALVNAALAADLHTYTWNGTDDNGAPVSSGVYLARIQAAAGTQTTKMLLLK